MKLDLSSYIFMTNQKEIKRQRMRDKCAGEYCVGIRHIQACVALNATAANVINM